MARQNQDQDELRELFQQVKDSGGFVDEELLINPVSSACSLLNKEANSIQGPFAGGTFKAMLQGALKAYPEGVEDHIPSSLSAVG